MIFKLGETNFKLPELTIATYYKVLESGAYQGGLATKMDCLASLTEAPLKEIKKLKPSEFNEIWQYFESPLFTYSNKFDLEGVTYQMVDTTKLTIGELASVETFRAMPGNQLHKIMAVLWRPLKGTEIEPFESETFEARAELFLNKMHVMYALKSLDFFLIGVQASLRNTVAYLVKEKERLAKKKLTAPRIGKRSLKGGLARFIFWLMTTLYRLKRRAHLASSRPLTSLPIPKTKQTDNEKNLKK